jgi:hypothetical protein
MLNLPQSNSATSILNEDVLLVLAFSVCVNIGFIIWFAIKVASQQ